MSTSASPRQLSSLQVRHYLRAWRDDLGVDRRRFYTFCAWVMEGLLRVA